MEVDLKDFLIGGGIAILMMIIILACAVSL